MNSRKIQSAYDMRTMDNHDEFSHMNYTKHVFTSFQDQNQLTNQAEFQKLFTPISPASKLKFAADEDLELQKFLADQHNALKPAYNHSEERHRWNDQLASKEQRVTTLEYELGMAHNKLGISQKNLAMFNRDFGNETKKCKSLEQRNKLQEQSIRLLEESNRLLEERRVEESKLAEDRFQLALKCNLNKDIQIMEMNFEKTKREALLADLNKKLLEKENKPNEMSICIKFEQQAECLSFNHMNSTPIQKTTYDSMADKIGALFKNIQHKNKRKKAKKVIGHLDTLVEREPPHTTIRKKKTKKSVNETN